jgi:hypothetical protein
MMAAVAIAGLGLGSWSLGARYYEEYRHIQHLRRQHPIALDLYRGRTRPGDDVQSLIARSRPHLLRRRGAYVWIQYYPRGPLPPDTISLAATSIMAKDGKVAFAISYNCTYQRTHFDLLTPRDDAEFSRLLHQAPGKRLDLVDGP